jgi:hypothetical protein
MAIYNWTNNPKLTLQYIRFQYNWLLKPAYQIRELKAITALHDQEESDTHVQEIKSEN